MFPRIIRLPVSISHIGYSERDGQFPTHDRAIIRIERLVRPSLVCQELQG